MVFKVLALDKWVRLMKIIYQNGGPFRAVLRLWRTDTLKEGKAVGVDSWGNTYYENPYYMIARSRWVIYNPAVKFEYDASQVTAEWAGWLHYRTDRKPNEDCAKISFMCCPYVNCWLLPHMENTSGSDQAYYPYSTTRAYIHVWNGKSSCEPAEPRDKGPCPTRAACDPCKK
ncbi:probable NADH dehydrogenase [ubiquinone] 1 alpha subcomplex subunit 12 [Pararge aegeria]|uniref:probable NADH dehydrogenase [ubiquinone] 1 alpha subcomplex subunit 12 n=1 Tax=Pararge aegeria TaxID=116150 RepID=UPI0019D02EA6|nr:probable NADH dehydrogenase [ubiquinone] 1 alpha subcomplex subunit 12 [Pararge aegeria]